jgi:hypothetical protein
VERLALVEQPVALGERDVLLEEVEDVTEASPTFARLDVVAREEPDDRRALEHIVAKLVVIRGTANASTQRIGATSKIDAAERQGSAG